MIDKNSGNVLSQGSGVVVNDIGFVLTAYHVVSSLANNNSDIIMATPYTGGKSLFYSLIYGGISFEIRGQDQISSMLIDLAILVPLQPTNIPHISLMDVIPKEGTDIIMAGFPVDLKTPHDISEKFKKESVGGLNSINKIKEFAHSIIPWIMVKHGIIGCVFHIVTPNMKTELLGESVSFSLRAAEYWVDNTYAKGASGGPIVDMEGNLLGIITETGIIYESYLTNIITFPIPSGTIRVLSHKLITWSLEELKRLWKPPYK
ncbi:hypothetical protein ES705_48757 [subsurface metagenome]